MLSSSMKIINHKIMEGVTKSLKPRFDIEAIYSKYRKYLKEAKDGQVVTRFPPEPSGFLHIGHVKAACLNYHYAKMFHGKMIMRFDDTNPSKEKDEFKESILADLKSLDIVPDIYSHTSDYFDLIIEKCTYCIENELAYCDATDKEEMQKLRIEKQASAYRDVSVQENLEIWKGMLKGENNNYCVRAKIDYKSANGCLRDPVIFRHNAEPHQVTGTKYKVYPTYDFACPIVDSVEGVTHALRTSEYADRNSQYKWFINKLGLRKVLIQDYSRLNFINTTLSKRKLNWFVEQGFVEGWTDPRFPTVQGILRRGMLVATIIEFMLENGPSKNTNLMEWDKIWSLNRKNIDPIALKFTAISKDSSVVAKITNFEEKDREVEMVPLHPKNAEAGMKPSHKAPEIIVEKEDLADLKEGDRIVLMKWGVFRINKYKTEQGEYSVEIEYLRDDTDFKKPKKLSWLPFDPSLLVKVNLIEYGHLLTVAKPDEELNFENCVNKDSKHETEYYGEGFLRTLATDAFVQFERRGYARLDNISIADNDKLKLNFIFIPDGKTKSMSGLASKVDSKVISKGKAE